MPRAVIYVRVSTKEQVQNMSRSIQREQCRDWCERNGYDVDKAETGNEAMEKINHRNYDLALIDLKLPDIEGTELLLKIPKKANKMAKIIVTGFSNVESGCRAAENGADEYLVKPVKPEELLKVISDYTT